MNNKTSKLEQAKEIVSKIERRDDGVSLEQASKWLSENWSKLYLRHGKEAESILKDFFGKFYEKYPDTDETSLQPVLGLCIAEEEHADIGRIMMWFTGANCWALIWRNFLEEKGINTRKNHEDRDDCTLIEKALWKEINDQRYEKNMRPLEHHYIHAKHATGHSENMAEQEKVLSSSFYYFQCDDFLAEDVVKVQFVPLNHGAIAKEIFGEIAKKENVLNHDFTGIGIGLWKKNSFIYATLRYSTLCISKNDIEE